MGDEASELLDGIPFDKETIATNKLLVMPSHDSSTSGRCKRKLVGQKRKCGRKGRRKSGTKKHRAGRNRNRIRKYKPYHKLSVSERERADARIEKRSMRMRAYYQAAGISLAPQNTTQFLLDDRAEADLLLRKIKDNNSDPSSMSERSSSSSDTDEFSEMWRTVSHQRFQQMSDQQLRECVINLEDMIEEAERKKEESITKLRIFQEEIRKYEVSNEVLSKVNAGLAKVLEDMHSKPENEVYNKVLPLENDVSSIVAL